MNKGLARSIQLVNEAKIHRVFLLGLTWAILDPKFCKNVVSPPCEQVLLACPASWQAHFPLNSPFLNVLPPELMSAPLSRCVKM